MVPAAVPETSALAVTSVAGGGMERERVTPRVGAGAGSATVNMKLVVSPVPAISGVPETHIVYVPAMVVESAVRVRVEVQVRLGVQEVGLNEAVTPVGKDSET